MAHSSDPRNDADFADDPDREYERLCLQIQQGLDINTRGTKGETPLHAAVIKQSVKCVRLLIEQGADVNAADDAGNSALHFAAAGDRSLITRLLMEHGANPDYRDSYGNSPLHIAGMLYRLANVKAIVSAGADVNLKDAQGRTVMKILLDEVSKALEFETRLSPKLSHAQQELLRRSDESTASDKGGDGKRRA